jgi:hypothetical protein
VRDRSDFAAMPAVLPYSAPIGSSPLNFTVLRRFGKVP